VTEAASTARTTETTRRIPLVTSDARTHPPVEADAETSAPDERAPDGTVAEGDAPRSEPAVTTRRRTKAARADGDDGSGRDGDDAPRRGRAALPLVPVLAVLLVLLLAGGGFLWFTRAEPSAVTTGDYVEVLQAARSNVVDFTSFDHLTLDDDIEQVRRVSVGDLRDEAVAELDERRQEITEAEAVVSTEVVAAGVTRADAEEATVLLVIQTTRRTNAGEQAQIVKYRIEVELDKTDDRWVLSQIRGA
jgi:hypothetical protein